METLDEVTRSLAAATKLYKEKMQIFIDEQGKNWPSPLSVGWYFSFFAIATFVGVIIRCYLTVTKPSDLQGQFEIWYGELVGTALITCAMVVAGYNLLGRSTIVESEITHVGQPEINDGNDELAVQKKHLQELRKVNDDLILILDKWEEVKNRDRHIRRSRHAAGWMFFTMAVLCIIMLFVFGNKEAYSFLKFFCTFFGVSCVAASYGILGRRHAAEEQLIADVAFLREFVKPHLRVQ